MKQNMLSASPPELELLGHKEDMLSQGSWCEVWGSKTPLAPSSFPPGVQGTPSSVGGWQSCAPQTHMPPTSAKCLHTGWHLQFHM